VCLVSVLLLVLQFELEAAADGCKRPLSVLPLSIYNVDSIEIARIKHYVSGSVRSRSLT
jgi:hypothetical protein